LTVGCWVRAIVIVVASMNTQARQDNRSKGGVTWAQACRDVVVTAINRGQLPVLGLLFLVALVLLKMPEEDVSKLVFSIVESFRRWELVAYPLLLITVGGWCWHAKWMRKAFSDEAERIGREKSVLQSVVSGVKYKSSNRK
jgi:hypothetical protein